MVYFVLSSSLILALLVSSIQTGVQSELLSEAVRILSDSAGYMSMSLTLGIASPTLTIPSSASQVTIFAASDTAFGKSGQPSLNVLQYHILPLRYSIETLRSLPYGTRIPTLFPNQSLLVSSFGGKVSLNGVRINETPIHDNYGALTIFGVDDFFNPSYQTSRGCKKDRWLYFDGRFENEIGNASAVLLSRGYSIMSSSLDLQLRGLVKQTTQLTIFAVTDSVLAPYSMNLRLGSVFHRHFLPCKLTVKDLLGLADGNTLRTFDKDITIQVSKSGELLLLNGVPVVLLVPELYLSDSIVVHGLNQIITEPRHQIVGEAFSIGDDDSSIKD